MKELKPDSLKGKKRLLQPILANGTLTKNVSWAESIYNESFLYFPEKADWRKRVVHTLFEWSKRPDTLLIEEFCMEYGILRRTLNRWAEKYDDIGEALENAKIFIGARRRRGAIRNELNGMFAYRDMHMYDKEWEKVNAYHAKLSADAKAQAAQEFAAKSGKEYIVLDPTGKVLNQ